MLKIGQAISRYFNVPNAELAKWIAENSRF